MKFKNNSLLLLLIFYMFWIFTASLRNIVWILFKLFPLLFIPTFYYLYVKIQYKHKINYYYFVITIIKSEFLLIVLSKWFFEYIILIFFLLLLFIFFSLIIFLFMLGFYFLYLLSNCLLTEIILFMLF